jgi:pyruvate,water dikinase
MRMGGGAAVAATWDPPGPGFWLSEVSHFPRPITATLAAVWDRLDAGEICERYGLPINFFEFRTVNEWTYSAPIPVPADQLGARDATAARVLVERPWLRDAEAWAVEREDWVARNGALLAIDVGSLDDDALAEHLGDAVDHVEAASLRHMELHLADMIPTGRLLLATRAAGIDDEVVLDALAGASPSSRPDPSLLRVAAAVRDAGIDLSSLDDVRSLGDEAADALADFLARRGWETLSRWDVDAPTVGERPDALVASLRRLAATGTATPKLDPARLDELPVERQLVDDALATFGLRDDNVAVLGSCSMGILRRAMQEAGRRLAARGAVAVRHAIEATPGEVAGMLRGSPTVAAEDLAARHRRRIEMWDAAPPMHLGDDDPAMFDGAGPSSMVLFDALGAYGELMDAPPSTGMDGLGIGETAHIGRAVVVRSPDEAANALAPGDVLVTFATSPGFDHLLTIAGAVVTVVGGLLSHAAVFARETGLTAVLGVPDATSSIQTGDTVEVDPRAGRVTVLSR